MRYIRILKGKIVSDEWIEREEKEEDKQTRLDEGF